jgi:hypothetical protein
LDLLDADADGDAGDLDLAGVGVLFGGAMVDAGSTARKVGDGNGSEVPRAEPGDGATGAGGSESVATDGSTDG